MSPTKKSSVNVSVRKKATVTKKRTTISTTKKTPKKKPVKKGINRDEIDSSKKFFESISEKIDQEGADKVIHDNFDKPKECKPASIRLYKKIALRFAFFTVILILIVLYFSAVKLTIKIVPAQELISDNIMVDIYDKDNDGNAFDNRIVGIVKSVEVEEEKEYKATGEEAIGEEISGTVFLINNYTKNQPLVATTRLLTSDNKLFRITKTINIPAGESLEVDIYADKVSPRMAIAPTKFTIPGLWSGLQDRIYAESKEAFVYRSKIKKYVKQSDIDAGLNDINNSLIDKIDSEIYAAYNNFDKVIHNISGGIVDLEVDAQSGDEVDSFNISIKKNVDVVAFPESEIIALAREKLLLIIPDDKELIKFDEENTSYNLDNYNINRGIATVKVSFNGKMALINEENTVDKSKIINLTESQLRDYLDNLPGVTSYELEFFPSFIKKVPSLIDRVKIEIVE